MKTFYQHLNERGLQDWVRCYTDDDKELVTFPLWTPTGRLAGFHQYNWRAEKKGGKPSDQRYYTVLGRDHKKCGVWGWEYLNHRSEPFVFVVEGVWDAITVMNYGFPALAVLGSSQSKFFCWWLRAATGRFLVGLLDDDDAGCYLGRMCHTNVVVDGGDMNSHHKPMEFLKNVCSSNPGLSTWINRD